MKDDVPARLAPVAANYVTSSFHASPERLDEIIDLAQPRAGEVTLDAATGTGNTELALVITGPGVATVSAGLKKIASTIVSPTPSTNPNFASIGIAEIL